ncbi:methyl-accepting chemotaxis sensory transducer with Cache sensor [Solirubrobacter pauli]|uniref:Methyl-accepting chemotaxis sensory transducer with Cache sensor n=1 Tax=Solirubrobacter pauli TaxID=166793 RepID=A0A660L2J5_9ACTN|nr:methyl-accepting chemotaxis protein [Solirubrobacter pauli]RKQ87648.1 methyl-accepting chemotaxis sensory transducer with Cache sensor [Solirubrobacter pauli]
MPKLRSLRSKMLALILVPVIVALAAVTFIAISKAGGAQKESSYSELNQRTAVEASKIDTGVANVLGIANTAGMILSTSNDRADATAGLSALMTANAQSVVAVYGGTLPNSFNADAAHKGDPGTAADGSFQPSAALVEGGKIAVTASKDGLAGAQAYVKDPKPGAQEPMEYEGAMYVTYQAPVTRGGKIVGYAGTASTLTAIDKALGDIKVYDTGYAYLVSGKGVLLASPDKSKTGKVSLAQLAETTENPELKQVADSIAAGKDGQLETKDPFTGKEIVLSWNKIDAAGWSFLTAVPKSEVLAPVKSLQNTLFIVGIVALILISLVILFVSNLLTKPIRTVTEAAERVAKGEVDVQIDVTTSDEIGQLATSFESTVEYLREKAVAAEAVADGDLTVHVEERSDKDVLGKAFNRLVDDLRGIVGRVHSTANGVSDASKQMAGTSDEAGRAIQEIAVAIGEVAEGTNIQVQKVEAVREAAERVAGTARDSAERAQEAAGEAEKAKGMATEGLVAAGEASAAMSGLAESASGVTGAIETLAAKSEKIGGIVTTITGLAEQTNLLALNAAIEAARAGEQGRGFAVVAEEVRKLAEESQSAAGEIAGLISEIQRETTDVVAMVADTAERTEGGTQTVERARAAFEAIGAAVDEVTARAADIAGAVEALSLDANQIADDVVGVATVAESASASSEQVSASTQQTSASTQEIAASAQDLAGTAAELEQLVSTFRLS